METNKIKEKFLEFNIPEYFKRYDNVHPFDWFIGLDQKGRKSLKLRAVFEPKKIKGTASIEINQFLNKDFNTIQFSLLNTDVSGLFYHFCMDMIESTKNLDILIGYDFVVNRFNQWKKMFVGTNKKLLTEPEIMGLIGELLFLRNYIFNKYPFETGLLGWSGVDNTHKDFSYDEDWYEIKTTHSNGSSIKISSLEQLDAKHDGFLIIYFLEKMSEAYKGVKLNQLIIEIRNTLENLQEKELFDSKILSTNYEYNDYYDIYSYALKSIKFYKVDERFPKLKKSELPTSIIKVQYELLLHEIVDFELKKGLK